MAQRGPRALMEERLSRSRAYRELFLAMMACCRIDSTGHVVFELEFTDQRLNTEDPHATAQSIYRMFTREQSLEFEQELYKRQVVALQVEDVLNRWIEARLVNATPSELFRAVCAETHGVMRTLQWTSCMEPTNAVRAIMSCRTRKQQQHLRGRVSTRLYRNRYRSSGTEYKL